MLVRSSRPTPLTLHPDRLFPPDPTTRRIARALHQEVARLPIVSPHGHTDPAWFATDAPFADPAALLVQPDHYLLRMLHSHGVTLDRLGIATRDGAASEVDPRDVWDLFAAHYHLFLGTPSRLWLDWVFAELFGIDVALTSATATFYYDTIEAALATPAMRPRALFDRFAIEALATTDGALDPLDHHRAIRAANEAGTWGGRVIPTYRPDAVVDPETDDFAAGVERLGALTGEDVSTWPGFIAAHRRRRAVFAAHGATATDHGHPSARTAHLPVADAAALYQRVRHGRADPADADLFRAQMLTEMARMSLDDGLVLQLHPGSVRNHDAALFARHGRDKGADIPQRIDFVHALRPLLDVVGHERDLTIILFTLDESSYARELAPLAGHYPCLRLGPAWWFHDSPEGMRRYRQMTTETAGFHNTVGFNDDTRAFLSIPARHDVARRMDCGFLAELVADHRLSEADAHGLARLLAYDLAKAAYRL